MSTADQRPKKIASLTKRANALNKEIGVKRDKLRDLIEELEAIADDCDEAIEGIDTAVRCLNDGADSLSRLL